MCHQWRQSRQSVVQCERQTLTEEAVRIEQEPESQTNLSVALWLLSLDRNSA